MTLKLILLPFRLTTMIILRMTLLRLSLTIKSRSVLMIKLKTGTEVDGYSDDGYDEDTHHYAYEEDAHQ